jgi:hypothetical protein
LLSQATCGRLLFAASMPFICASAPLLLDEADHFSLIVHPSVPISFPPFQILLNKVAKSHQELNPVNFILSLQFLWAEKDRTLMAGVLCMVKSDLIFVAVNFVLL